MPGYPPPGHAVPWPPGYPVPPVAHPGWHGQAPGWPAPGGPPAPTAAAPAPAAGHVAPAAAPSPEKPPGPADATDWIASIEAAAAKGVDDAVALDGSTPDSIAAKLEARAETSPRTRRVDAVESDDDEPEAAAPETRAVPPVEAPEPAKPPNEAFAPPDLEGSLEVDFAATRRSTSTGLTAMSSSSSASMPSVGSTDAHPAAASSTAALSAAFRPPPRDLLPRRLLGRDPVSAMLLGLAIGALVGLVAAYVVVRASFKEDVVALESELTESYLKPIEVELGDLRSPDVIESELADLYTASKRRFWVTFVLAGGLLGVALGRFETGG